MLNKCKYFKDGRLRSIKDEERVTKKIEKDQIDKETGVCSDSFNPGFWFSGSSARSRLFSFLVFTCFDFGILFSLRLGFAGGFKRN